MFRYLRLEWLLYILSKIYLVFWFFNRLTYQWKLRKIYRLPVPVISVGNLTVGGTGKTPAVISLVKHFQQWGKKVAVITRGYKFPNKSKDVTNSFNKSKCIVVTDKEIQAGRVNPDLTGDEAILLAQNLPDTPIIVSPNRYQGGLVAVNNFTVNLIILDDGFQHYRLHRDLDIVCLDVQFDIFREQLFPLGTLREPVKALNRAEMILLTHSELVMEDKIISLRHKIRHFPSSPKVVLSCHQPYGFRNLQTNEILSLTAFSGKKIIALSSLGNNYSFVMMLNSLALNILHHYSFPDHYAYRKEDLEQIIQQAKTEQVPIITTAKDKVRLQKWYTYFTPDVWPCFYTLEIELQIKEDEKIWTETLGQYLNIG